MLPRILVLFVLFALPSLAEDTRGSAASTVREVVLKKEPSEDAPSLGRLPKGTILTLKGERRNGFAQVDVELESGTADGWVRIDALNRRARGEDVDEGSSGKLRITEEEESGETRPRSKIVVPKDEAVLLRRESSFFYGLQAGGNFAIIQSDATDYMGIGLVGGAHLGFYLDRAFPARLEVGYLQMAGTSVDDFPLNFGFIDTSVSVGYLIDRFELFGSFSYALAVSSSEVPADIKFGEVSELSSLYGGGGLGYTFPMGEVSDLAIRLRYMLSFLQQPVALQGISLQFYFQLRG